jgi:hypothetical protein
MNVRHIDVHNGNDVVKVDAIDNHGETVLKGSTELTQPIITSQGHVRTFVTSSPGA